MSRLFDPDSSPMRFLSAVFDFALLNLLTLLCALPVITAGAALAALSGEMLAYRDGAPLGFRRYVSRFRQLLPVVTLPWLGALVLGTVILLDFRLVAAMPDGIRPLFFGGLFFFSTCLLLTGVFFFPLAALHGEGGRLALVKRSFITALAALPRTACMVVLQLLPLGLFLFFPWWFWLLMPFWLLLWLSLSSCLCVRLAGKYLPAISEK